VPEAIFSRAVSAVKIFVIEAIGTILSGFFERYTSPVTRFPMRYDSAVITVPGAGFGATAFGIGLGFDTVVVALSVTSGSGGLKVTTEEVFGFVFKISIGFFCSPTRE
jgi:hypothetical protein